MRVTYSFPCLLIVVMFGFMACGKPEPIQNPVLQVRQVVQAPTPTVVPAPTPVAVGVEFRKLRLNQEMMTSDQTQKYGRNLSGKKIEGWIGYFVRSIDAENGLSRIVIDMDKNAGGLPDVVLEGIPQDVAKQFTDRQGLNFSGTIQGYVSIPGCKYNLSMTDVKIYSYFD